MAKKRFSLLIDDDTPTPKEQEQYIFTSRQNINRDDDERPRLSLLEPKKTEEEIQQKRIYTGNHINFRRNYSTSLRGHMFTRTYGVETVMHDTQKDKTSTIQFDTEITIRQFPDWGYFEYKIKRENVFINKRAPKTFIEKLAVTTSKALYPLEVQTTLSNELLKIINHQDIIKRWAKIKATLQKEYTGKVMASYITKFEKQIKNPQALLLTLKHESFYTLLFHDIYTTYGEALQKNATENTITILDHSITNIVVPIENQLGGHANTRTVAQVESELQQAKTKLENLKKQRKTAPKLPTQEQKKDQSKTLENYLDYNNPKGSREIVEDMERKVFYKWQWDVMRQFGASNNFLEPLP